MYTKPWERLIISDMTLWLVFKSLVWSGLYRTGLLKTGLSLNRSKLVWDWFFIIFWINIFTNMLPSFNISYRTLKSVEKWVNYNIITQVYNFYWKFLRFHNILITFSDVGQYLCSWAHFEGKIYLYTSTERNRS